MVNVTIFVIRVKRKIIIYDIEEVKLKVSVRLSVFNGQFIIFH